MKKIATVKNFNVIFDACKDILREIKFDFNKDGLYILGYAEGGTLQLEVRGQVEVEHHKSVFLDRDVFKKFNFSEVDFYDAEDWIIVRHENTEGKLRPNDPRIPRNIKEPIRKKWESVDVILTKDEVKQIVNLIKGDPVPITFSIVDKQLSISLDVSESKFSVFKDVDINTNQETTISSDLLEDSFKTYSKFDTFTIGLGNDCPLQIAYGTDDLKIDILIAPRIKEK